MHTSGFERMALARFFVGGCAAAAFGACAVIEHAQPTQPLALLALMSGSLLHRP
jgi:hypothetical protein